jgi:hypothetical protein
MSGAGLHFAAPWALAALALLPLLWLILRAAPPAPRAQSFPPFRLLLGLRTADEAKAKAPLWLIILRMAILALAVIGFARPSLAPRGTGEEASGRVLIVVDDGWTLAAHWSAVRSALQAAASDLEAGRGEAHLLLTAPAAEPRSPSEALTPGGLRGRAAQLEPQAWRPDRAEATRRLEAADLGDMDQVIWLSDGLASAGDSLFIRQLQRLGPVRVRFPDAGTRAVTEAVAGAEGVRVVAVRSSQASPEAAVSAETQEGRSLGVSTLRFEGGRGEALIALPPEIAVRTARVRLIGEDSAGAVRLLPEGASRPSVGLADPGGGAQPLLNELYYVERALQPFAALQRGPLATLIENRAQALVLPDASRLAPGDAQRLKSWLDNGGVLVRFAGPRLANDADDLTPVRLRVGTRALGSALSWEQPQTIAAFSPESPFAGLVPPPDVVVRRQVLAAPGAENEASVWAALQDGSPLVTAAPRGEGLIILFHVSAGPEWSDLPLSGLYVQMLRRVIALSGRAPGGGREAVDAGSAPYRPVRLLDGFGSLREVRAGVDSVPAASFAAAVAGPLAPPGLYERAGLADAIDAAGPAETLEALALPAELRADRLELAQPRALAGGFLSLAAFLAALDLLVSLFLSGRFLALRAASCLVLLCLVGAPQNALAQSVHTQNALTQTIPAQTAQAKTPLAQTALAQTALAQTALVQTALVQTALVQTAFVQAAFSKTAFSKTAFSKTAFSKTAFSKTGRALVGDPTLTVRLAYVVTGDAAADRQSREGLTVLSDALFGRTAVEPGPPIGVNLAGDELSVFPFIYWPAPERPQSLGPEALANLDRYLRLGGMLLVDTRDAERASDAAGPAATMLRGLDAPPLERVTEAHVVARSFYLLRGFPGRHPAPELWAETQSSAAARDGVASLFVGDGDWAAAWAGESGVPSRQRELALRFGVNLVMVALTGNYKADQVHVPALLERLGREGRP